MAPFPETFLDELRAAIKISDLIGEHTPLHRKGAGEFVALSPLRTDTHLGSFTINDNKGIFHDFANEEDHGDIFDFTRRIRGCDFPEAVKILAERAGMSLPGVRGSASSPKTAANKPVHPSEDTGAPFDHPNAPGGSADGDARGQQRKPRKTIVKTYDYQDAKGTLAYQVVRFEPKSFAQRRPSPAGDGTWVWGLDYRDADGHPLEFMRKRAGADWQRFDPTKFESWHYTERTTFDAENVQHGLYNFPEVAAMLALPAGERPDFHWMEGEKDADLMKSLGFIATTNSGGAKHVAQRHADLFAGCKVIIHQDNDDSGRKRTAKLAPMLVAAGASVFVCDLKPHWPAMTEKQDIHDWLNGGGGSEALLYGVLESLQPWKPAPYSSKFGAVDWGDQYQPGPRYEYLIKGIIPRGEPVLIHGETQSGKSFETMDMAMHVATPIKLANGDVIGKPFAGRRVKHGGVVYCAYEAGKGFRKRMNAYHKYHDLPLHGIPFTVLTRPHDLFSTEENVTVLCDEILALAARWDVPLEVIAIDTHNAATPGSSEIKSEDMSVIIKRYKMIMERTGASIWIVGHTNAEGKHRGNAQLANGIETIITITREEDKGGTAYRDDDGRVVRRATVMKQREGEDRFHWDFVLRQVEIGRDEEGEPITSCVSVEPNRAQQPDPKLKDGQRARKKPEGGGFWLKTESQLALFQALIRALDEKALPPPPSLQLPPSITKVVKWSDVAAEYRKKVPMDEGESPDKYRDRLKKRFKSARDLMMNYSVIGMDEVRHPEGAQQQNYHVIWPTGKRVAGDNFEWPPGSGLVEKMKAQDKAAEAKEQQQQAAPEPQQPKPAVAQPVKPTDEDTGSLF